MSEAATTLDWLRRRVGRLRAAVVDPRARSEVITRLRFGAQVHQDVSLSCHDRYPSLFTPVCVLLAERHAPRILSYGCAAGEEVTSLRGYFPDAMLVGAEINPALLRICRKLPHDPQRVFIESRRDTIAAHGPYDAIFAMAVFTRRPNEVDERGLRDISGHYPFALFAADLRFLADQVAPGGLLIVEHAQYLVEDALRGMPFSAVPGLGNWLAKGPRFDPQGIQIEPQPCISRIFRRDI